MDKDAIYNVAQLLGASEIQPPNNAGYVHINCPLAAFEHEKGTDTKPSFGIHVAPDSESSMHCFSCHWSGELTSLIQRLKFEKVDLDYKALMEAATAEYDGSGLPSLITLEEKVHGLWQFPEPWLKSFPSVFENGQALTYLATRDGGPVPHEVIQTWDLRWDAFRKRVCTPIRGWDHRLYGLHGRSIEIDAALKYLALTHPQSGATNPHVWLGEHLVDWTRPVVLAESKFDLFRTYQVYRNVISNLKAGLMEEALTRIKPAFEIVTLFDRDKAGDIARNRITKWAQYSKGVKRIIRHVYLEPGQDGGSLTVEQMAEALAPFVDLDPLIL